MGETYLSLFVMYWAEMSVLNGFQTQGSSCVLLRYAYPWDPITF